MELGIAYADKFYRNKNKFPIGLQTDIRAAFISSKLNPMLSVPLDFIAETEKELLKILKKDLTILLKLPTIIFNITIWKKILILKPNLRLVP